MITSPNRFVYLRSMSMLILLITLLTAVGLRDIPYKHTIFLGTTLLYAVLNTSYTYMFIHSTKSNKDILSDRELHNLEQANRYYVYKSLDYYICAIITYLSLEVTMYVADQVYLDEIVILAYVVITIISIVPFISGIVDINRVNTILEKRS
jgi:hypothetical protein